MNGVDEETRTRKEKLPERKEGKKFSILGSLCEYFYNKNKKTTQKEFTVRTAEKGKKRLKKRK